MKNIPAIQDFSDDFTEFQVENMSSISSVSNEISQALSSSLMEEYFMDRINELAEDLYFIATQDEDKSKYSDIRAKCVHWVNHHIRNASNLTLVALVLWLDGMEDGRAALVNEAKVALPGQNSH